MDLSREIVYPKGAKYEFGLLNPVRNETDDQLFALALQVKESSQEQRTRIRSSMSSATRDTLLRFAGRSSVFALRDNDPAAVLASFAMLAMVLDRIDPRDTIIASGPILYVAGKLGVKIPDLIRDRAANCSNRHIKRMIGDLFEQDLENAPDRRRSFLEVQTRFGTGLIDRDRAPFEPECDLLDVAIEIAERVRSDEFYSSVNIRIESGRPPVFQPNRGGFRMIARPDPDSHPDMRNQMFHMRLVEFPDEEILDRQRALIGKANRSEVQLKVSRANLLFTIVARSVVVGVGNVETSESLERFVDPVQEILKHGVDRND